MSLRALQFDEPVAVIGDIHGQARMLRELLAKLGTRPVLVTGDVGDRGPDTREVIGLLAEIQAVGVLGNHDEWLRHYAVGGRFDSYALSEVMGGKATLESYGIEGRNSNLIESQYRKIPKEHRDWLSTLALLIDLEVMGDKYWLTHAGVSPALPADEPMPRMVQFPTSETIWVCWPVSRMRAVDRPVIMGHMVVPEPLDLGHVIAIDTGAVFSGGSLTALLLPERTFLQVG